MTHAQDKPNAMFELWDIFLRHRWRFIYPAFVVMAAILVGSMYLPRLYRAEAVFERRTDMVLAEIASRGVPQAFQSAPSTVIDEVAGPIALDQMLEQMMPVWEARGWVEGPVQRQMLHESLQRHLNVSVEGGQRMDRVRVQFMYENRKLAEEAVDKLVQLYIERAREAMEQRLRLAATFFEAEMQLSRNQIEQLDNQLLAFEIQHAALLPTDLNNVQMIQSDTETTMAELISRRDTLEMDIQNLKEAIENTPETLPNYIKARNPELTRLEQKRRDAEEKLLHMINMQRMTDRHPDVIAQRNQIALLEQQMSQLDVEVVTQTQWVNNPKRGELEMQLTRTRSEHEAARRHVERLQQRMDRMSREAVDVFAVRSEYQKLQRERSQVQRQLTFWEEKLQRVNMALTVEHGNRGVTFEYTRPASSRSRPVSPVLTQILMAALGLGLMSGSLCVFMAHRADETFHDDQQLSQSMNLPVFGAVSELITRRHRRLRRMRKLIIHPISVLGMTAIIVVLSTVVYLDLENPKALQELKGNVKQQIRQWTETSDGSMIMRISERTE